MPVAVREIDGKNRIVELSTGEIHLTKTGKPADGGGHEDAEKADRQAGYINAGIAKAAERDEQNGTAQ